MEWHPGEPYLRVGYIVTNLSRPTERVVAFYNQRGKAEQYIKEGKYAIKWTRLSCRKFRNNAVRLQLHALAYNPCQLHADAGSAERGGALVADDAAGEAGQDRCQGRQTRMVRDLPIGRSGGGKRPVPAHFAADRWAATGPFAAMTAAHPVASRSPDRTGLCCAGRSAPYQCKMVTGRVAHRQISSVKSGPRPIVPVQGPIRDRMPIVLPLSAIGRSHLGNPG